jgi:hypothetical protein
VSVVGIVDRNCFLFAKDWGIKSDAKEKKVNQNELLRVSNSQDNCDT